MAIRFGSAALSLIFILTPGAAPSTRAPHPAITQLKQPAQRIGTGENRIPAGVPQQFRRLYASLDAASRKNHSLLNRQWDGKRYEGFMPAASVLPANSNAGLEMLAPQNLEITKKYVLALKDLGCLGVQLDIQYPVYDPAYFQFAKDRGLIPLDSPDDRDFRRFYRDLVQEIRGLGLKVFIENQVTFTQKTWSPLPVSQYYEHLNGQGKAGFEAYKKGRMEMAKLIAADLQPDFLTVSNEPDTEMDLTGILPLQRPENYLQMVQEIIVATRPVLPPNTKLGAGIGIWIKDWEYWVRALLKRDIDFFNIHLYPVDIFTQDERDNIIPRTLRTSDLAHEAGKSMVMGETWLYKMGRQDSRDPVVIYGRDYFAFWAPLDQGFLGLMFKIGQAKKFDYISPFWSSFFFSYLTWEEGKSLSTAERKRMNNRKVLQNLMRGRLSETGLWYKKMNGRGLI